MTDNRETCVDPYLDSFAQSFAAANYTAGTIRTYRHLARKLGRLMGTGGIAPSALTPDLADQLARTAARGPAAESASTISPGSSLSICSTSAVRRRCR